MLSEMEDLGLIGRKFRQAVLLIRKKSYTFCTSVIYPRDKALNLMIVSFADSKGSQS